MSESKQDPGQDVETEIDETVEVEGEFETAAELEEDAVVEENNLEKQLADAQAKADDNWDQLVRTKAEMENIRRRSEKDVTNARKYALEKFAQELLPVIDSMEMGVSAAMDENADITKLREGNHKYLDKKMNQIDFEG